MQALSKILAVNEDNSLSLCTNVKHALYEIWFFTLCAHIHVLLDVVQMQHLFLH